MPILQSMFESGDNYKIVVAGNWTKSLQVNWGVKNQTIFYFF